MNFKICVYIDVALLVWGRDEYINFYLNLNLMFLFIVGYLKKRHLIEFNF